MMSRLEKQHKKCFLSDNGFFPSVLKNKDMKWMHIFIPIVRYAKNSYWHPQWSDWSHSIAHRYCRQLTIKVIDQILPSVFL